MRRRVSRWGRIVGTGAAFALFGLLGVALGLSVYPAAKRCSSDPRVGEFRVQRLVHWTFRAFVRFMKLLGLVELSVHGAERLRAPSARLIVANHPTLLDVVMLGSLMPQLDCVVKREAWSNPFMRGVVTSAGYIPNDLGEDVLAACAERLQQGRRVLLFPEGTRSPKGQLGTFRRGAAHVALSSQAPILPVVIRCEPASLMRGQKWYDVPDEKLRFSIEVGEVLDPRSLVGDREPRASAARDVTRALRDFYAKTLQTLSV
ncbi:MAG: 1-acyl-sn-glycerol-3-phosphate acyltransferase [Myxococcales bacterium]|nr:1-acyl-sn-glycerol-3-phosphate acyltransferase [Myxococcales bacterium]